MPIVPLADPLKVPANELPPNYIAYYRYEGISPSAFVYLGDDEEAVYAACHPSHRNHSPGKVAYVGGSRQRFREVFRKAIEGCREGSIFVSRLEPEPEESAENAAE